MLCVVCCVVVFGLARMILERFDDSRPESVLVVAGGWLAFIPRAVTSAKEVLHICLAVPDQSRADIGSPEPLPLVPLDRAHGCAQPLTEVLAGVVGSGFVAHGWEQRSKMVCCEAKNTKK